MSLQAYRRGAFTAAAMTLSVAMGIGGGTGAARAATAEFTAPAEAGATADFDVFLPLRNTAQLDHLLADQQTEGSPRYHAWLTPGQFTQRFGADDATVQRLTALLRGIRHHPGHRPFRRVRR
jgi:hypothetical protein